VNRGRARTGTGRRIASDDDAGPDRVADVRLPAGGVVRLLRAGRGVRRGPRQSRSRPRRHTGAAGASRSSPRDSTGCRALLQIRTGQRGVSRGTVCPRATRRPSSGPWAASSNAPRRISRLRQAATATPNYRWPQDDVKPTAVHVLRRTAANLSAARADPLAAAVVACAPAWRAIESPRTVQRSGGSCRFSNRRVCTGDMVKSGSGANCASMRIRKFAAL
jgi:hypothetical protein